MHHQTKARKIECNKKNRNRGWLDGFALFAFFFFSLVLTTNALAVPETNAVRISDITTSSFSLVWMTDIAADPGAEVYADAAMQQRLTEGLVITPMPAGSSAVAMAARTKGIMKVRVTGAQPATTYYVRTVTKDPSNPDSTGYSSLQQVTTASSVELYRMVSNAPLALSNDLLAPKVYVRPTDQTAEPRLGDLILLEETGVPHAVSAFVGDGAVSPEGILDLNNLFGADGMSLLVSGGETLALRIYRGGSLSILTHYRRAPQNSAIVSLVNPVTGFFADIDLDGKIDDLDFTAFRAQYRTLPNDGVYNPDFNFVDDPEGVVDVREFGKFSKEYGRTNVQ